MLLAEKRPVGLDADGVAIGGQMSPQAAQQSSELAEAEQQRLSPVQNDREARLLASGLFD